MKNESLKSIVDALIFASEMPLGIARIRQIVQECGREDISVSDIKVVVEQLNADNRDTQRGFYLQEVAGGYQYRTRPNYAQWIKKIKKTKSFRLTQSTLETLAIIAYKQPIIRADVEKVRGVDSGGVIKNLIERNLIKIVGRRNIPGRPFLFGTTRRFLEVFGLDRLEDLPSLKDFDNLDEGMLPTMLREKIPQELFDVEGAEESEDGADPDAVAVTDEQLHEASRASAHDMPEDEMHGGLQPADEHCRETHTEQSPASDQTQASVPVDAAAADDAKDHSPAAESESRDFSDTQEQP